MHTLRDHEIFDIEFLLRQGAPLAISEEQRAALSSVIAGFTARDFKVTLGSVLEAETRAYYVENGFAYLKARLQQQAESY